MNCKLPHRARGAGTTVLLLAALLVLVTACTPLGTVVDPGADPASNARAMAQRGDHSAASRAYLDLAVSASGNQRQRYLIFAAGELYLANDIVGAERVLSQAGTDIAAANMEIWAEVAAEIRLAQGDAEGALQVLNMITSTDRQTAAERILLLRAEALFSLGRPQSAVATLLQREQILDTRAALADNRKLIWSGLQGAGASIPATQPDSADPVLAGWLQLGYLAYSEKGSLSRLYSSLQQWQRDNPGHPAAGALLDDVLDNLSALSNYPARVALLLPLSGKQQGVGEAIRDGYLVAHFEFGDGSEQPDIRLYDTARAGAVAAYQQAITQGAQFIVGPLLRENVAAIVPSVQGVTTLALNNLPEGSPVPPGLYQFALAPEDEARAVARRAAADGQFNAVVLTPANDWGRRIGRAFAAELRDQGGAIVAASSYSEDTADFSALIENALLLDESYARRERLAANIGKQVEFEPRRRQDIDYIFIAATAPIAKLLRPQLRFHYAGDIPSYATSAVYQPGSDDNSDLNGIIFPDIPWLLNPTVQMQDYQATLEQHWGPTAIRGARFYALGHDAYRLTALLHGRSDALQLSATGGATGNLRMDTTGSLYRELAWARFERGKVRALPQTQRDLTRDTNVLLDAQAMP